MFEYLMFWEDSLIHSLMTKTAQDSYSLHKF